jgi:hypothetical protein
MEKAVQIAWNYLESTGELGNPEEASQFLINRVEAMIRRAERSRLVVSSKAICAYQRAKAARTRTYRAIAQPTIR